MEINSKIYFSNHWVNSIIIELKPNPKPKDKQKSLKPASKLKPSGESISNFGKSKKVKIVLKINEARVLLKYLGLNFKVFP